MAKNKLSPEIVKLGSIYFGGEPQVPGGKFIDGDLTFGDTVPGMGLSWVKYKDLLVADRCVCDYISWEQLNELGYIFGYPIRINGKPYRCRSLDVGSERNTPNEWFRIMASLGSSNELWHWKRQYFWGQNETTCVSVEFSFDDPTAQRIEILGCAARGYDSSRNWNYFDREFANDGLGFRPVLESLFPHDPSFLIGKQVRVYGPKKTVFKGKLIRADEYDYTLEMPNLILNCCDWAVQDGEHQLVFGKDNVLWMEEA